MPIFLFVSRSRTWLLLGEAKGKASFCEQKEAKKLYLCWAMGGIVD
jgi:hypothetical protein